MILYDNAFLPNWLLQGMFYIIPLIYLSIPDFLCQNDSLKRIVSTADCDSFYSNTS